MKEIQIVIRLDEETGKIGHIMKHKGFAATENITKILSTIAILDNLKQHMLNKIESKEKTV